LDHKDGPAAGDKHNESDKEDPSERMAEETGEPEPAAAAAHKKPSKKLKPLTQKQLLASQKASSKTGVIYISRVPPFMKPQTVKHILSPYGEIGRIFLTPEDPAAHTRRVKSGGNKKRSFTDGWVEFLDKKNAKIVAETLNAQIIGGKKGGWYHDDVWNIKYLKGFKWHHLTEQIANENAERAARLRAEIAQTTRENKLFLQNVEKAKMLDGIKAKRKKKQDGEDLLATPANDAVVSANRGEIDFRRQFRQNEVKLKTTKDKSSVEQPEEVKRVLSKIF
jgi:ESF2/ABP1 family protein